MKVMTSAELEASLLTAFIVLLVRPWMGAAAPGSPSIQANLYSVPSIFTLPSAVLVALDTSSTSEKAAVTTVFSLATGNTP